MTRARWARRGLAVLLAALALLLVIRAIAPWDPLFQETLSPRTILAIGTWGKFFYLLVAAVVSTLLVRKFEAGTTSRIAWRLLSLGIIAILLGQACIVFYQFALGQEQFPYPSWADVFFIASYPAVIAALLLFLRAYAASGFPIGPRSERIWLGLGVAAVCVVGGYPILKPILTEPAPPLEKLLNVLYPILDTLLVVPAVLLIRISLRFRGGTVWKVWSTLLGGFVCLSAADTLFSYFIQFDWVELGDLIDAMFLLGYGCLTVGVLYQRDLLT
jgi:diguanylate cyclase